jgi:hypothetical protein
MGEAVPPLPQYAFMAWCSVRGSTGTTLPFTFICQLHIELKAALFFITCPCDALFLRTLIRAAGCSGQKWRTPADNFRCRHASRLRFMQFEQQQNTIWGHSKCVTFIWYSKHKLTINDEMDWDHSTHGTHDKFMGNCGWKTSEEDIPW